MRKFLPQSPVPRALVDSSYVSHGDFFGSHGATNLHILLLLFLVFMMYLRRNSTTVTVKPNAICQTPPSFPGWVFVSSTTLGVGATATYRCSGEEACFLQDVSTCDAQGVWSQLPACNPEVDCRP